MTLVQTEPKKICMVQPSKLPAEYQEVEYIQSSGTQYIDTGYEPNNLTNVVVKFNIVSSSSLRLSLYGAVNTASDASRRAYLLQLQPNDNYLRATVYSNTGSYAKQIVSTNTLSINTDYTVEHSNTNFIINGTSQGTFAGISTYNVGYNMYIFSADEGGTSIQQIEIKLYSFKITENDTLIRDFVPCYRKADSVIGMYDLVNDTFYTNSGTGTFTKGNDVNFVEKEINRVTIRPNGTEKQIRPVSQPVTTIGIYWSASLGVISFQTSNGVGISIADKNLGATQVYNSGDTLSFANMGYGYQWGNNYGWAYGVDPVNTTKTQVNASTYGPGNYYSSSTFIIAYNVEVSWDSSNNANLWGGTTNTYAARQGPAPDGWHIPSKADAQTLVDAISSITGSVNVSKINQYCKLPSVTPGIGRMTAQWINEPRGGIRYSDEYHLQSGGMLYLPTSGNYVVNENSRKSEALPLRPFSNTFIQPTNSWIRLDNS